MDPAILVTDLVWAVIAAFGIGVALWAVIDGYIDRHVVRTAPELPSPRLSLEDRETIVRMGLRGAWASLLLQSFFFILGVITIKLMMHTRADWVYYAFAAGYIVVEVANVRAVGLNQLDRLRLRRS